MMNKGFTLIEFIIYVSGALILGIILYNFEQITNVEDVNCGHEYVITSKYDLLLGQYRTISKCVNCGYEI